MKMGFSRSLLLLTQMTLINLVSFTISQADLLGHFCNYTSSDTYQANRNTLLSSLSAGTNQYGFYSSSYGENPDIVYAMVLCRADVELDLCRECVNNATAKLGLCPDNKAPEGWDRYNPNDKEGIVWYDNCTVRYSSKAMEGIMAGDPRIFVWDDKHNITSIYVKQFTDALRNQLRKLRDQAAGGGTQRKFASGNAPGPANYTIYALTQCTPDLSTQDCSDCLQGAIDNLPLCCNERAGGRVLRPSCNFRYEIAPFFGEVPAGEGSNRTRTRTIVIIGASITTIVIVLIVSISILLRKKKQGKPRNYVEFTESGDGISSVESLQYNFDTICVATDNFSNANKLGQGGFGAVYKGRLLNGQEIAVKRLDEGSHQGDIEFKNEVMLVAKLQHRNLVRLLGFCLEGRERLLIYEFVPNSSLDNFLFDRNRRDQMDWDRRRTIIGGIARGLVYLHEDSRLRIIHRDLKASNILLDEEMNPKIADFGMARLFAVDETQGSTRRIVGTPGYMAPEYMLFGQFSVKSDVFSYGVLLLEILSGQKNNCFRTAQNVEDLISYDNMLLDYFCDYTSSATYQTNRDTLLSSLSAGINKYGYYSSSHGEDPDTVYAMVLCRADAELDLCRECINKATAKLVVCPANKPPSGWGEFDPNDKEGIVWYDYCMVRYSSKAMEGIMAGDPRIFVWKVKHNVTSIEQFTDALRNLLNNLRVQAAGGGAQRKFALGNAPGLDNYTIYALTQCTPDLSKQDCSDCLQGAIDNIPLCCKGRVGGRVLRPSCNFRYEIGPFFQEIPGI